MERAGGPLPAQWRAAPGVSVAELARRAATPVGLGLAVLATFIGMITLGAKGFFLRPVLLAAPVGWGLLRAVRPAREVAALAEDIGAAPAWITLSAGGITYATDRGAVRLIDGWVVWTGVATNFSLPPSRERPHRLSWTGADGMERTVRFHAYGDGRSLLSVLTAAGPPPEGVPVPPPDRGPSRWSGVSEATMGAIAAGLMILLFVEGWAAGKSDQAYGILGLVMGLMKITLLPGNFRTARAAPDRAP